MQQQNQAGPTPIDAVATTPTTRPRTSSGRHSHNPYGFNALDMDPVTPMPVSVVIPMPPTGQVTTSGVAAPSPPQKASTPTGPGPVPTRPSQPMLLKSAATPPTMEWALQPSPSFGTLGSGHITLSSMNDLTQYNTAGQCGLSVSSSDSVMSDVLNYDDARVTVHRRSRSDRRLHNVTSALPVSPSSARTYGGMPTSPVFPTPPAPQPLVSSPRRFPSAPPELDMECPMGPINASFATTCTSPGSAVSAQTSVSSSAPSQAVRDAITPASRVSRSVSSSSSSSIPTPPSPAGSEEAEKKKPTEKENLKEKKNNIWHTALVGKCEYFPFPKDLATPPSWPNKEDRSLHGDGTTFPTFVGQVRFTTSAEEVSLLIDHITGTAPVYVAAQRAGCFVAHFATAKQQAAFIALHHAIYFDLEGAWIAKNGAGRQAIKRQITLVTTKGPAQVDFRQRALPCRSIVIERYTDKKAKASTPPSTTSAE